MLLNTLLLLVLIINVGHGELSSCPWGSPQPSLYRSEMGPFCYCSNEPLNSTGPYPVPLFNASRAQSCVQLGGYCSGPADDGDGRCAHPPNVTFLIILLLPFVLVAAFSGFFLHTPSSCMPRPLIRFYVFGVAREHVLSPWLHVKKLENIPAEIHNQFVIIPFLVKWSNCYFKAVVEWDRVPTQRLNDSAFAEIDEMKSRFAKRVESFLPSFGRLFLVWLVMIVFPIFAMGFSFLLGSNLFGFDDGRLESEFRNPCFPFNIFFLLAFGMEMVAFLFPVFWKFWSLHKVGRCVADLPGCGFSALNDHQLFIYERQQSDVEDFAARSTDEAVEVPLMIEPVRTLVRGRNEGT